MNKSKPETNKPRSVITFHTSPLVRKRLDILAKATARSRSFLTNEAVTRYLAEEEAFIREVEASIAEADAGLLIGHNETEKYLRSLGTKKVLPMPKTR